MINRLLSLAVICSATFLIGCNSLDMHASYDYKPALYPAVRSDCRGIFGSQVWSEPFGPIVFGYLLIDMPFSLVVDTLYVPADAIAAASYKQPAPGPTVQTDNIAK